MLSGIHDAAPSVHCELCALPRDMDLGNYLLTCADFYLLLSVQVFMRQMRERHLKDGSKLVSHRRVTLKAGLVVPMSLKVDECVAELHYRGVRLYFVLSGCK